MPDPVFPPFLRLFPKKYLQLCDSPFRFEDITLFHHVRAGEPEGRRKGSTLKKRAAKDHRGGTEGTPGGKTQKDSLFKFSSGDLFTDNIQIGRAGLLKKKRGHCAPFYKSPGMHEAISSLCPCFRARLSLFC